MIANCQLQFIGFNSHNYYIKKTLRKKSYYGKENYIISHCFL